MKLFAALLAASAVVVTATSPAAHATYAADCGGTAGCMNTETSNDGDYRGNQIDTTVDSNGVLGNRNEVVSTDGNRNRINTGTINRGTLAGADVTNEGGKGGKGGDGGGGGSATVSTTIPIKNKNENKQGQKQGQQQGISDSGNSSSAAGAVSGSNSRSSARGGDQRQSQSSRSRSGVRNSGNSSNSNTNSSQSNNTNSTSSSSSADNNGNSQTLNYTNIDIPEATVAPLPENGVPGQIGDVVIPLPSIRGGVFTTRDNDIFYGGDRSTTGATIGFQIPLGTGQVVAAAEQIVARRESAARFQLIREATWMLQQGVLDADAHPEHWAALYGAPPVASVF